LSRKHQRAAAKPSPFARAVERHQAGDLAQAQSLYRKALDANPADASSHYNLGLIAFHARRLDEAADRFARAAAIRPDYAEAHANLGAAYRELGRLDDAVASLDAALTLRPADPLARATLGLVLSAKGQLDAAMRQFSLVLDHDPGSVQARFHLAGLLSDSGAHAAAIEHLTVLVNQEPNLPEAWFCLAMASDGLGRIDDAIAHYWRALQLDPTHIAGLYNLAGVLQRIGRFAEAVDFYQRALDLRPNLIPARLNLGLTLLRLGRMTEAIDTYASVMTYEPEHPDALLGLGEAYQRLGRQEAAIEAYRRGLAARPESPATLIALGALLQVSDRLDEAIGCFSEAVRQAPDMMNAWASLVSAKKYASDWANLAVCEQTVLAGVRADRGGSNPFLVLTLESTPADQLAAARHWTAANFGSCTPLPARAPHGRGRIRVGYVSADFRRHATAYLATGIFEHHHRERFEIVGYSINAAEESDERRRLERAFDRFVDINPMSHDAAARLIHADEIDILIDLKGYTGQARTEIFAHRPAPIQVNYLGYPGTMGAAFMDYILVDPFIVPDAAAPDFSEKLVQLPVSYQPNMRRPIAETAGTRKDHGLPDGAFVFCSFNQAYKITPQVFDIWMRLLANVPGSVLWLLDCSRFSTANLRREAAARGIDPARLVFAPVMNSPEHLARHRHADLFLDTLPVCAHTTASDALWAGLPLVSCIGQTFITRVSGSLLTAVGLPELLTQDLEAYEALALHLARNPGALAGIRARLMQLRMTSPLFDPVQATHHIEIALQEMWRRHRAGEAPAGFSITANPS
jgi:predicted O-linked N-acetylglucosamine transferase (SPINDLY family)